MSSYSGISKLRYGLTLVEVSITLAVLGILATLSINAFDYVGERYQSYLAKLLLLELYDEVKYYQFDNENTDTQQISTLLQQKMNNHQDYYVRITWNLNCFKIQLFLTNTQQQTAGIDCKLQFEEHT